MSTTSYDPEECAALLTQKIADLREDLGSERTNFKASFCMELPRSPALDDAEHEWAREKAHQDVALEGVLKAREMLDACGITCERPPSMFAEMVKSDERMQRIRDELEDQQKNKERIMGKNKQARVAKVQPMDKQKARPGISMKPKKQGRKPSKR